MVITYIVMAYIVMAYIAMAYIAMAYIVMAYIVMAYIAMAYIVRAYIVMALHSYGLYTRLSSEPKRTQHLSSPITETAAQLSLYSAEQKKKCNSL